MKKFILATVLMVSFLHAVFAFAADGETVETSENKRSYDLKVITYNVCGLPDFVTFKRGLADTNKRFAYAGQKLNDYDIIGLQEVFIANRHIIEEKLKSHYVVHGTDVGTLKKLGSGVYTFSRWPILKSHFEQWDYLGGADALSHKGFVAATIQVDHHLTIDVYNLHGQTKWTDKKLKNYSQLADFMEYYSLGKGRPVLLIGDFNCHLEDEVCDYVMKRMNMNLVDVEGAEVDHIFFNENESGWKISALSAKISFTEKLSGKLVSDHDALEAVIRIEKAGE